MRNLDDIALLSPLRRKNTTLKVLLVIFALLAGLFSSSPILPIFIMVCMIFATLVFGKIPPALYFKLFLSVLGFVAVSCVLFAFVSTGKGDEILLAIPIFRWTLTITQESANYAVLIFTRSLSGIASLFFLSMTTPMLELFSYFKRFSFLDVFMELVMLIYRYIFVFLELLLSIQSAQSMRFGYRNFKTSLRSAGMLVGSLFIQTLEQGDRLYLSMNSRCYDGKLPYYDAKYKILYSDALVSMIFVAAVATVYIYTRGIQFF
ncbi:cobalt ECF transporter T component CbiQ [Methanimicrococcus blatticola]|uniref:Cobalt/nickel transport system permease protein n=1 Tax=Methanimicrococcus blatticola TaxID=91560 RepID=A0A484F8P6_9EURY|nr:cobalt ECF transporter T component CbiQ [Methanimicrococcus blatticola]MBZ3934947.1 cobalt ECF transporter T component CbiQ [Methanimicrococcus blatticola]MCC2508954.1 cobalt ECF transporter T component CbiQ [Methanimicrococcus blatticola]TDQ71017.1 cobalt/nickel transport system permease protein [Methanimicrococcus blatticola]